jgi:hypothetical protein
MAERQQEFRKRIFAQRDYPLCLLWNTHVGSDLSQRAAVLPGHKNSRSLSHCPSAGGSISCHIPDEQIGKLIEAIELVPKWFEEVLSIISLKDEVDRIKKSRQVIQEKLPRLAKTYNDLLITEEVYYRQKRLLEL